MDDLQNGPGTSLFQGSDSLQINPVDQREEEEEALADQQLRNQELHRLLSDAFDDLYDDDDDDDDQSTINSSHHFGSIHEDENEEHEGANFLTPGGESYSGEGQSVAYDDGTTHLQQISEHVPSPISAREEYMNSRNLAESQNPANYDPGGGGDATVSALHYQHCYRTSPGGYSPEDASTHEANEQYRQTGYNSLEQLQVLYEVRVREVRRLSEELAQQKQAAAQEKDQVYRKLALREAEKERAQMLYKQAQSLHVEYKEKITVLENKVDVLEATVVGLEKVKSDLAQQLEVSRASVMDLHGKISVLERGVHGRSDQQMDAFLRNVQSNHNKELKHLENEVEAVAAKFSKRDHDYEVLQKRTQELIRQYEAQMVQKGETINQLSRSLEDSQHQCQQLMSSGAGQEMVRLKVQLQSAVQDKEELQRKQQELTRELESLRNDLQHYEAVAKMGLFRPDESVDVTDSMVQLGLFPRKKEGPPNGTIHITDLNSKLREELQRSLIGQKLKREEIARLRAQLTSRDENIAALQKQEAQYLVEVEKLKAEYVELIEELNNQREIAKKALAEKQKNDNLEASLKKLQAEEAAHAELETALAVAKEECKKHKNLNVQLQHEIDELRRTLEEDKKRAINQYSEEYLQFHDQALERVRKDRNREHEAVLEGLRVELDDARRECDRVKQLYIEVCGSKEELNSKLQQERKASQDLADQLEKLEAEMRAFDEAERGRAAHHEANLHKLRSEKEKLEEEKKTLGNLQALQQELESEKSTVKELEATLSKILGEKEKVETELKTLSEFQTIQKDLETERVTSKELKTQLKTALLKICNDKEVLEAMQKELTAGKDAIEKLKEEHEAIVQRLKIEKENMMQEAEDKTRQLYTVRVTEEIEKAKTEALTELEKDWSRRREEQDNRQIKQLEAESKLLHKEIEVLRQKHVETETDYVAIINKQKQQLEELKQVLQEKHEQRSTRGDATTSHPHGGELTEMERIRRELTVVFSEKLSMLQTKHQLAVEETSERVKDETVRYFAEQIRQAEARHRADLLRVEQAHKESVASLRETLLEERSKMQTALSETESKLLEEHERMQNMQAALMEERARLRDNSCWKARAEALAGHLEESKQQALEAEKNYETLRSKYRTAKKTALSYKAYAEAKEKHLSGEWQRINSGFRQTLEQLQNRLEMLTENGSSVSNTKVVQCTEQIKQLREKLTDKAGDS